MRCSKGCDHVTASQSAPMEALAKKAGTLAVDSVVMCQKQMAEVYKQ
jgi:hypothetical protein